MVAERKKRNRKKRDKFAEIEEAIRVALQTVDVYAQMNKEIEFEGEIEAKMNFLQNRGIGESSVSLTIKTIIL